MISKPELESLSYLPKPLKRGFLGLNAHVIKPETRTNKNTHEPIGCPDLETMHLGIPNITSEQPKPTIAELEEILTN